MKTSQIFDERAHVAAFRDLQDDVGGAPAFLAGVGEAAGIHNEDPAPVVRDRPVRVTVDQDVGTARLRLVEDQVLIHRDPVLMAVGQEDLVLPDIEFFFHRKRGEEIIVSCHTVELALTHCLIEIFCITKIPIIKWCSKMMKNTHIPYLEN